MVVLLVVPGTTVPPGAAVPVVPLVGALLLRVPLLGAVLLGVLLLGAPELGIGVAEPGVMVVPVDALPVVPLDVPVPLLPMLPVPVVPMVLPAAPLREPLIVLPLIDAFAVLSTPSADKVAASVALPPVMPCACLKFCRAARVFGPIFPSTAPGLWPLSVSCCWMFRTCSALIDEELRAEAAIEVSVLAGEPVPLV